MRFLFFLLSLFSLLFLLVIILSLRCFREVHSTKVLIKMFSFRHYSWFIRGLWGDWPLWMTHISWTMRWLGHHFCTISYTYIFISFISIILRIVNNLETVFEIEFHFNRSQICRFLFKYIWALLGKSNTSLYSNWALMYARMLASVTPQFSFSRSSINASFASRSWCTVLEEGKAMFCITISKL